MLITMPCFTVKAKNKNFGKTTMIGSRTGYSFWTSHKN